MVMEGSSPCSCLATLLHVAFCSLACLGWALRPVSRQWAGVPVVLVQAFGIRQDEQLSLATLDSVVVSPLRSQAALRTVDCGPLPSWWMGHLCPGSRSPSS